MYSSSLSIHETHSKFHPYSSVITSSKLVRQGTDEKPPKTDHGLDLFGFG
ncbi:MAG: hypothetical protein ACKO34_07635 [Vampirovibrionales bacterium]